MTQPTLLRERELDRLQKLASAMHRFSHLEDLAWHVVDEAGDICGLNDCVFYVRLGNVLTQVAALGVKRTEDADIVNRLGIPLGTGIVGTVGLTGRMEYVADVSEDSRYIRDEYSGKSEFAVPFVYRDEVLGVLDSESDNLDDYSELTREILQGIAALVAPHLAALLRGHEHTAPGYAEAISELTRMPASANDDLQATYARIAERAARVMRVSRAQVWLLDEAEEKLEVVDAFDLASSQHSRGQELMRSSYPGYFDALERERVLNIVDARNDARTRELSEDYLEPFEIYSKLVAPVRVDGELAGIICFEQCGRIREWSQEEVRFTETLSDFATIALISERRLNAETALASAQRLEALGRLAGGIAHDFNNLLMVISGAVETVGFDGPLTSEQQQTLALISDATDRAASLTRKLVDFGGSKPLDRTIVPAQRPIDELRALSAGIVREDIRANFGRCDDQLYVSCDTQQLSQVLLNLLINAVDAMPRGGELSVAVEASETQVIYSVSDTGVGIEESALESVFEPFFTTKGDMGSGLGLSSSLGIVKKHGGQMTVESKHGAGSQFSISLPRVAATPRGPLSDSTERPSTISSKLSILLVEDEEAVRNILHQMLRSLGHNVTVAMNAKDALAAQINTHIDLLISDIVMPGTRGTDLYKLMADANPGLRAVLISGYNEEMLDDLLQQDSRVNFLPKPFSLRSLDDVIQELISR